LVAAGAWTKPSISRSRATGNTCIGFVDKDDETIDFPLRAQRAKAAAKRHFEKSID
jgi:transposase-like protein